RRAEARCGRDRRRSGGGGRDRRHGAPAAAGQPDAVAPLRPRPRGHRRQATRLMWTILLAALLGLLAGVLAGLFGVGGGILFVPTLTLGLGLTQLHAEATSLLAIIPTAVVGTWRQTRYRNVDLRAAALIGVASIAGVQGGVLVAESLPEHLLR